MRRAWLGIVDFVVGDDPWIAVAVVLLLAVAAALVRLGAGALVDPPGRRSGCALALAAAGASHGRGWAGMTGADEGGCGRSTR